MTTLNNCNNVNDFRRLAKKKLPFPIFHYIDGAAEDEVTYRRNTESFEKCFLVPNVLKSVKEIDLGVSIFRKKYRPSIFLSPTALQGYFIIKENML